jgi:Na+/melibiose symporter-like transporter
MDIKFNVKRILLASLLFASLDALTMIYNSYVPIYLQAGNPSMAIATAGVLGFGLGPALTGFILTLDNIASLILTPIIGVWSDGIKSKMGRRKPFLVYTMPFMVIALFLLPIFPEMISPELNGQTSQLTGLLVGFMVALLIILTVNAIMWGPNRALLFDITPSEHRTTANGVANVLDGIVMVLVVLGGAALFNLYKPIPFWIVAVLVLVSVLVMWAFVREPQTTNASASEAPLGVKEILQTLRAMKGDESRSLIFYSLTLLFAYLAVSVGQAFVTSYAVTVLGQDVSTASAMLAVMAIVSLVMAVPSALIANRFTRKRTIFAGLCLSIFACALFIFWTSMIGAYVCMFLFSFGWILFYISNTPMMIDQAPSDKYLGTFISIDFFVRTLGLIIGPTLGGWIIEAFGNNYQVIWPLMIVFLVLAVLTLLPVTRGEAKKVPASS